MSGSEYEQLLDRVDVLSEPLFERYASHLKCRRGCYFCCANIAVLPVEHHHIRRWLAEQGRGPGAGAEGPEGDDAAPPRERPSRDRTGSGILPAATGEREGSCPLLDGDGGCSVYAARPVICRVHGLPLAYPVYEYDQSGALKREDERMDLWCDLNFSTLSESSAVSLFDRQGRIDMVTLNRELEAINRRFLASREGTRYEDERRTLEGLRRE